MLGVSVHTNDLDNVLKILAVVGDPKAAKKRLEELVAAQQAIEKATDERRESLKKLEAAKAEFEKREKDIATVGVALQVREAKIVEQEERFRRANLSVEKLLRECA